MNEPSNSQNSGFSGKADIKSSIIFLMTDICTGAKKAMTGDPVAGVSGWSAQIETFDAILFPTFVNDKEFMLARQRLMNRTYDPLVQRNSTTRFQHHLAWFRLLCRMLPKLGIFGSQDQSIVMESEEEPDE